MNKTHRSLSLNTTISTKNHKGFNISTCTQSQSQENGVTCNALIIGGPKVT